MTKERVVEREKAVVRGQGDCWGGEDVLFLDNRPLPWQLPFLCEAKKSQVLTRLKGEGAA
ncbi:MAG: hypothetical protein QOJ42_4867 [Acidobacteriaceae bacterium]|nr:hypothetical protein [Acidobacteriaceae bacterium]